MSIRNHRSITWRATHGVVSLTVGFLTGLVVFVVIGAAVEDAVFSALALALVVTASRVLRTGP